MAIKFFCPKCKKAFSVKEKYAGKKAKCPCGARIVVPAVSSTTKQPPSESFESKMAPQSKDEVRKQKVYAVPENSSAPSSGTGAQPAHIATPTNGSPGDSRLNNQPVMSVDTKRIGRRKGEPWRLDIYDTYALFTDPENSTRFRFPDETKPCIFATPFLSGYNFSFVPYSKEYRFLLDKDAYSHVRTLYSNWSRLQNAKRREQGEGIIDSESRSRLAGHVRFWSGLQLVIITMSLPFIIVSGAYGNYTPVVVPVILLFGFMAANAWRLRKWAIFCEALLFTGSSIGNLAAWLWYDQVYAGVMLAVSTSVAAEFFRAFKAGVSSADSHSSSALTHLASALNHLAPVESKTLVNGKEKQPVFTIRNIIIVLIAISLALLLGFVILTISKGPSR